MNTVSFKNTVDDIFAPTLTNVTSLSKQATIITPQIIPVIFDLAALKPVILTNADPCGCAV